MTGPCLPVLLLWLILLLPAPVHAQTPDIPDLVRVTMVHSDLSVLLEWEHSSSPDIVNYHVYKMNSSLAFEKIASLDPDSLRFRDVYTELGLLSYSVTAEDSKGNESLFADNVHKAVSLQVSYDICKEANLLNWTRYEGWEGEISAYRIMQVLTDGTARSLGFVSEGSQSFTHSDILTGQEYRYYIETVHISGTPSLSAIERVSPELPAAPEYLQLDQVSVVDRGELELLFSADVSGPVNSFRILRKVDDASAWVELGLIRDASQEQMRFQDRGLTSLHSYTYRVESVFFPGDCQEALTISSSGSSNTILLNASKIGDNTIQLSWNGYSAFPGGLLGYEVEYRTENSDYILLHQAGTDSSYQHSFEPDPDPDRDPLAGRFYYRIRAIEDSGGKGLSFSNVVSQSFSSDIRIPTAITPRDPGSLGINDSFKPLMDFQPEKYQLIVADRNGRRVFETRSPEEGWPGTDRHGGFVPEGVYVYYLQYTDFNGIFRTLTGNVTVLY